MLILINMIGQVDARNGTTRDVKLIEDLRFIPRISMTGTCRRNSAGFKARGRQADPDPAELSKSFQAHPVQISQWKKPLPDGVESSFRDGRHRDRDESQALQAELEQQIGRLNEEVEWLKKESARCGRPRAAPERTTESSSEHL